MENLEPLTPEQARTIDLPLNPITRIRKIGELATRTMPGVRISDRSYSPFRKLAYTRKGLISLAEIHESSVATVASLREVQQTLEQMVDNNRMFVDQAEEVLSSREPYSGPQHTLAELEE